MGLGGVEWSGRGYESSRHPFNIPHTHSTSALVSAVSSKNSYLATSGWNLYCCKLGFELSGFCYSIAANSRTLELKGDIFETQTETIF